MDGTVSAPAAERISAAESERLQRAAVAALLDAGAAAGDRIVVVAPPSVASLSLMVGALRAGIVPVPLHPGLVPEERAALIADAEPVLVVEDDAAVARLVGGGHGRLGGAALGPVPRARPMHYTSGTSGRPKGVWSGVLDEAAATALVDDETAAWGITGDDVHLVCSSLSHSAPLRFAMCTLLAGGDVVLLRHFDERAAAAAIAEHRPTSSFMAPVHLQRLIALGDGLPDLSCFRLLAHAGAPCPERVKHATVERWPEGSVHEFYGSTEGQFTIASTGDWRARPGSVGRARPGRQLRVDSDGVIWCQPPPETRFEYWRDPAKTAAAWQDGWFTVGDLGRLDDDGYLYLDGRRDDLIITGGVNVYPAEVEAVLGRCPGVDDVAVFGADDERWGQRVCAAVIGPVTDAALEAYAREHLAAFKRPKQVIRVDALPRTATGKVRRRALDRLAD